MRADVAAVSASRRCASGPLEATFTSLRHWKPHLGVRAWQIVRADIVAVWRVHLERSLSHSRHLSSACVAGYGTLDSRLSCVFHFTSHLSCPV